MANIMRRITAAATSRSNVIDFAAYREIRSGKLSRSSPQPAAQQTSLSLQGLYWPPLMFPLVWTSHWMLTAQNALAPRDENRT